MSSQTVYVITYKVLNDHFDTDFEEDVSEVYGTLEALTQARYMLVNFSRSQIVPNTVRCVERTDRSLDSLFIRE